MKKRILLALIGFNLLPLPSMAGTSNYDNQLKLICNNTGGEEDKVCVQLVSSLISTATDQGKISYICDKLSQNGRDVTKEQKCVDAKEFEKYFNKN
ncbi:TPA: hypothetical protein I8622_002140 [Klebsiella oxytoca]|nr:hypothetical protein [Klebsiella oxytoca]